MRKRGAESRNGDHAQGHGKIPEFIKIGGMEPLKKGQFFIFLPIFQGFSFAVLRKNQT